MNTFTSHRLEQAESPSLPGEYLAFRLGSEQYGIDILRVQEIRSYEQPTRMAHAPEYIKGVVNLRGRIVPILDLRMKLHCAEVTYNELTVVIILDLGTKVIGAVVDSVADVVSLPSGLIKRVPQFDTQGSVDPSFVQGIANVDDRMLILMDIAALLTRDEIELVESTVEA